MKLFMSVISHVFLFVGILIPTYSMGVMANCEFDKEPTCSDPKTACMNIEKDKSSCVQIPTKAPISNFILPFDEKTEVVCTHASGVGSHSWPNAYYALDLATPYELPPSIVRASADGKAFVFLGEDGNPCPTPIGTPAKTSVDQCGLGWGNHIKILHNDGYFSFYVHLDKVLVQNGQIVRQGVPIGIEGATGLAGYRHLHWSVQKLPGKAYEEWEKQISWDGISVPFNFTAIMNGAATIINSSNIRCTHASIGQVPSKQQPRLRGMK